MYPTTQGKERGNSSYRHRPQRLHVLRTHTHSFSFAGGRGSRAGLVGKRVNACARQLARQNLNSLFLPFFCIQSCNIIFQSERGVLKVS